MSEEQNTDSARSQESSNIHVIAGISNEAYTCSTEEDPPLPHLPRNVHNSNIVLPSPTCSSVMRPNDTLVDVDVPPLDVRPPLYTDIFPSSSLQDSPILIP